MKRLVSLLILCLVAQAVVADEPSDHPFVGRYDGSTVFHQEISQYGEYTIATGPEETESVQGEVWMTLYDGPEDTSTFTVYSTYLSFLEDQGFDILLSYSPGDMPGAWLDTVYQTAPFADDGNFAFAAPITNGNDRVGAYIAARKDAEEGQIYVCIAIAAGWRAYPQYKLDIVQTGTNAGSIVSTGTPTSTEHTDAHDAVLEQSEAETTGTVASGGFLTGNGYIQARAGMEGYLFLDPAIAGGLVVTDDDGTVTVQAAGIKNSFGPFGEVIWYPNENLGFGIEYTYINSDEAFTAEGVTYRSQAEMQTFRAMIQTRVVGSDFPSAVTLGFGGGLAIVNLSQSETGGAEDRTFVSEDLLPVFGCSIEMTAPILSFLHLSTGVEYTFIPFTELVLSYDGATPYSRTYHEGNLGGLALRLGLVGAF